MRVAEGWLARRRGQLKVTGTLLLTACFGFFLCDGKAFSQDGQEGPTGEELTELMIERARKDNEHQGEEVSRELRSIIIDKGAIAEETHQRMIGLRERGNPHIRKGLRLQEIEENPERIRVDTEKMREERIRMVQGGQTPRASEYRVVSRKVKVPQPAIEKVSTPDEPDEETPAGFPWVATGFAVAILLGVFGAMRWLQVKSVQ